MTNVSRRKKFLKILIFFTISLTAIFIFSCEKKGSGPGMEAEEIPGESTSLYLFDYREIILKGTSSIGTEIKNCNAYLDIYGDLVFFGELENTTSTIKTDIEITMDFLNSKGDPVHSLAVPIPVNYLRKGAKYPFHYYFTDREKYIDLSMIKAGVNYREYYKGLEGNPIAETENYFYEGDYLIIEGRVINLGKEKIKNIKLLCTFYDNKNRIVFIKECYLMREKMMPLEEQNFTLKVLLDQYLEKFTHYYFEVFFEDEIKVLP